MKVLMVNNQLSILGGSETYMFSVGDELERRGHDVQYFGRIDPANKHGNKFGIYANSRNNPVNIIKNRNNCLKFGELLDKYNPDIVHYNLIYFALTPAIVYETKSRRIPSVQTVHDPKIVCPCHRFYIEHKGQACLKCVNKLEFSNCIKNKCIKGSFSKSIMAYIESEHYKRKNVYHYIDRFIFPSYFMMNQHVGRGIDESQAIVLHNFSRIEKRKTVSTSPDKYILFFGRIGREKGAETLAEACKMLPAVKFKIAGSGDMDYLFKDLENCELVGFKTGIELEDLIAQAVASVIPSIWYENCPMSVLESIALGTPVIGANIGGIPELIENNKTGFVFEPGNANQLADLIKRIFYHDELTEKMSYFCIDNKNYNTVNAYVDRLISLYREL